MLYYKKHVLFCINQKKNTDKCCQNYAAESMCNYAKAKIKELNLSGKGGIRVSSSGCLGRCISGPNIVIYPEGIWYSYKDQTDIDEIITKHLLNDLLVERLIIKDY